MNGMTLVEMLVVLAIISIGAAVSAVSFAPLFDRDTSDQTARAGAVAISTGAAVRTTTDSTGRAPRSLLFLPDGRAIGTVDPMIGGLRAAGR